MSTWSMALRQSDYYWTLYRRTWKGSVFSSFLTPLLYVLAMGVLLGGFVEADPSRLEGAPSYLAFVAPGLLAAQTMQTAVFETTYPVLSATKWQRVYFGMNATPLRALDIANAALGFVLLRLVLIAIVFVAVLAPFGVFVSVPAAIGALLVSILVGAAIGMPVYAYAVGVPNESSFSLIFRLGVIPQFLFSGAFFPISNLSPALEWLARLTPLYQGVDLTRMLSLGTWHTGPALVHLAYLLVLLVVFHRVAVRRLAKRLAF
ncbi:ABC transporter [Nocardioides mangrovicus]|uniref:Transport permease protein n=1 Tax=Nocardioides mangrovicus TaxID=2478913 RepID=A0A3L8P102_9ACTN|nr:ABC transporter permease [Nocardioides mangrovicus]RLV48572.1 ABC transporter [Nocardioides mangrovicus]